MKPTTYKIQIPPDFINDKGGWELLESDDPRNLERAHVRRGEIYRRVPGCWLVPEEPPKQEWLEGEELEKVANKIPMGTKVVFDARSLDGPTLWMHGEFYKLSRLNVPSYGVICGLSIVYTCRIRIHLPSLSESQRKAILGEDSL